MHIAEVVTIAKSLPLLRLNTYKSLILSYSADYRRILLKNRINCFELSLIDNVFCESMFQMEKEYNLKRDSGSVFFEKIHNSFVSAEQQGKK